MTTMLKLKRKRTDLILMDYDSLSREEAILTIKEMRELMKKIFRNHIGEEESITPAQLFYEVFRIYPANLDIFKRNYWWNVLKSILRELRKSGELFVINKRVKLFVLKTQEEADWFRSQIDNDIKNLKNIKKKANEWVKKSKWRKL